jgi:hypothetical protein
LTELLEIPQLLESCIHNELFDSSLDVILFAKETFHQNPNHRVQGEAGAVNIVIQTLVRERSLHPRVTVMLTLLIAVLHAQVREVEQMMSLLRAKLLQKLREDLPLALCVRIVGYLRRLDALVQTFAGDAERNGSAIVDTPAYERQLKEEFLRCRSSWLASLSRTLPTLDPYQFVRSHKHLLVRQLSVNL